MLLYLFFYLKGKGHEKEMIMESFANEMIVDSVAQYPNDLNKGLIPDQNKKDVKSCSWCVDSKDLSDELIWHNAKFKNDDPDMVYDDEQREMDGQNEVNPEKNYEHKHDTNENSECSHNNVSNSDNKHRSNDSTQTTHSENKHEDAKFPYDNSASYNSYVSKMKKTKPHKNKHDNWFVEPDPSILAPYGFVYMPNTLWSVPQERPPVCLSDSKCLVQPTFTSDKFADLYEYTGVGTILPTFSYKETPGVVHPDKQKYFQELSEKKRPNPYYFYPGWYGYELVCATY